MRAGERLALANRLSPASYPHRSAGGDHQQVSGDHQRQKSQDQAIGSCLGSEKQAGRRQDHQHKTEHMDFKLVGVEPVEQTLQCIYLVSNDLDPISPTGS
jgi:hypothetical protein